MFIGLCIIHNVLLDSGAVRPRGLLFDEGSNNLCSRSNWYSFVVLPGYQDAIYEILQKQATA